jgi:hypothetical protein
MGAILRFVDKETLQRKSVLLGIKLWVEGHDAAGHAKMVRSVIADWGITVDKIDLACTDNAAVMIACVRDHLKEWRRLACCAHTLQLTLTDCLDGEYKSVPVPGGEGRLRSEGATQQEWTGHGPPAVALALRQARVVANYHTNKPNSKLNQLLHNTAVADGEKDGEHALAFLKPSKTRWTGDVIMSRRMVQLRSYMLAYLDDNPGEKDCCLEPDQHRLLQQMVAVLEDFVDAMDLFQTTDRVTISKVYPVLINLLRTLNDAHAEYELPPASCTPGASSPMMRASDMMEEVKQLRKDLSSNLFYRWFGMDRGGEVYQNFEFYGSAAYLDARNVEVKELFDFTTSDGRTFLDQTRLAVESLASTSMAFIVDFLKDEMDRTPYAEWVVRAATAAAAVGPPAPAGGAAVGQGGQRKRMKLWGSGASGAASASSAASSAAAAGGGAFTKAAITPAVVKRLLAEEMAKYAVFWSEERARVYGSIVLADNLCPLEKFWATKRDSMPVLCFLAHMCLSIPPSSADAERSFSFSGFTYNKYRQQLDPQRLNEMMIVNWNWDMKYLDITKEEKEHKAAARAAHKAAIAAGVAASHALKKQSKLKK